MPYTYTWEPSGLYRKFVGEVSGDEILQSNFELHSHPQFESINYIINDFTEMTGFFITTDHTRIYAKTDEIISNTKGRLKISLVATHNEHIALAENYRKEMKNNRFECEIFNTVENAREWVSHP